MAKGSEGGGGWPGKWSLGLGPQAHFSLSNGLIYYNGKLDTTGVAETRGAGAGDLALVTLDKSLLAMPQFPYL